MISIDVITHINNYTNSNNIELLNKEISREIILITKSKM